MCSERTVETPAFSRRNSDAGSDARPPALLLLGLAGLLAALVLELGAELVGVAGADVVAALLVLAPPAVLFVPPLPAVDELHPANSRAAAVAVAVTATVFGTAALVLGACVVKRLMGHAYQPPADNSRQKALRPPSSASLRSEVVSVPPVAPRVLVVQNSDTGPVGRVGDWLTEAGLELHVITGSQLPPNLDGWAAVVVLGGEMGANDDDVAPWLPHERALLREAVSREVPTLGICLGGQLLAAANGGRVERSPEQAEIGAQLIAKRTAASTDPLFGPLPITPDVLQWHYDAITVLPPGAVQLASSPVCENQAFRLGRLAWGVQFHIETTPELVRSWAAEDAAALDGVDVDRLVSRAVAAHDDIAEVWAPFAHAFAAVVRDPGAVSVARGVPTSIAAPITDPAAIRAALAAEAAASSAARVMLPMPTTGAPTDGSAYPPRRGDGA